MKYKLTINAAHEDFDKAIDEALIVLNAAIDEVQKDSGTARQERIYRALDVYDKTCAMVRVKFNKVVEENEMTNKEFLEWSVRPDSNEFNKPIDECFKFIVPALEEAISFEGIGFTLDGTDWIAFIEYWETDLNGNEHLFIYDATAGTPSEALRLAVKKVLEINV